MMQTDVSCLFLSKGRLKRREIGDGVTLEYVRGSKWWEDVRQNECVNGRVNAKVTLAGAYNHRFFVSLDGIGPASDGVAIESARQLILRTIVLSRIVRPNRIASGGLWVETEDRKNGDVEHRSYVGHGEYGLAYVGDKTIEPYLTDDDLAEMVDLWPGIQRLFQDEPRYRRIVRALVFFDSGFHQWCAEFRHLIFHAALESMICTRSEGNRAEVTQRLPELVPSVTKQQAIEIYQRCCEIKHEAAPFPYLPAANKVVPDANLDRYDSLKCLERALRDLLRHILVDHQFADLIADRAALDKRCPVTRKTRAKAS